MENEKEIEKILSELQAGMQLAKCRKCQCMKETLTNLLTAFPLIEIKEHCGLIENVEAWVREMEPTKYACLGCEYCFAAAATNILTATFPSLARSSALSCTFDVREEIWPPVAGEYFAFCEGSTCSVAVSTLASIELAEALANIRPQGLCIVGKTETENIGIDKVIKNTITNPAIRFLIVAGEDPKGHHSGETILSLWENGIDRDMTVIASPGRRPILKNVSLAEVESFRRQVQIINMIGCVDTKKIIDKIHELSRRRVSTCDRKECGEPISTVQISSVPRILARKPQELKMDKAGYLVVIPIVQNRIIVVEHYAYDNQLLHIIEGKDAPSIYSTIIENGWVTELSHAAYLGRELAKAELSLKHGLKYIQDKAPGKVGDNTK